MEQFSELFSIVEKWAGRGERRLKNGTKLICPVVHGASQSWLHVIFAPAQAEELQAAQDLCGMAFPTDLYAFLLRSNGMSLFSGCVKIWGIRKSYVRVGDDSWQPLEIADHNASGQTPQGSPSSLVFFASIGRGAEWCFLEPTPNGHRVGKTDSRKAFSPTGYWPDFWSWLLEQAHWLEGLFSEDGTQLIKDIL
jgi:hypothetical protein